MCLLFSPDPASTFLHMRSLSTTTPLLLQLTLCWGSLKTAWGSIWPPLCTPRTSLRPQTTPSTMKNHLLTLRWPCSCTVSHRGFHSNQNIPVWTEFHVLSWTVDRWWTLEGDDVTFVYCLKRVSPFLTFDLWSFRRCKLHGPFCSERGMAAKPAAPGIMVFWRTETGGSDS